MRYKKETAKSECHISPKANSIYQFLMVELQVYCKNCAMKTPNGNGTMLLSELIKHLPDYAK